jgi:hypothetical protein
MELGQGPEMSDKEEQTGQQSGYQSYLLRLWRAKEEKEGWRASLHSAQTGRRRLFATLDALFDYVRAQTRSEPEGDGQAGPQERR